MAVRRAMSYAWRRNAKMGASAVAARGRVRPRPGGDAGIVTARWLLQPSPLPRHDCLAPRFALAAAVRGRAAGHRVRAPLRRARLGELARSAGAARRSRRGIRRPGLSLFLLLRFGLALAPGCSSRRSRPSWSCAACPASWPVAIAGCLLLTAGYARGGRAPARPLRFDAALRAHARRDDLRGPDRRRDAADRARLRRHLHGCAVSHSGAAFVGAASRSSGSAT